MRSFAVLLLCIFNMSSNGQFEITGDTCSGTSNYHYTYHNYSPSPHRYGFNIYRNQILVYNDEVNYAFLYLYHMHFINDSTGFIAVREAYGGIAKTETYAETWEKFHGTLPYYSWDESSPDGLYFINEDIGYFATFYNDSCRLHKILPPTYKHLYSIKYDSVSEFINITDTISNTDYYCDELNNLFFNWYLDNDTIQFKLSFVTGSTLLKENAGFGIHIFPNPTKGNVKLESSKRIDNAMMHVLDCFGQEIAYFKFDQFYNESIHIQGPPGIYFLKLVTLNNKPLVYKLIKQ
ncbi:MAG: T9SS type A sorting domain-containing protein [Bacteroidales bacterium]|nr:T9SS type A sorting domain-containing protein [Bacteroidales bacterium]MCF8388482.1 T9SS type A sorting domain-containing protein [Bacteroidales bacterium]MCF8397070.1 T9SS type A sorting domain-containing protein [Bacteroidales bacterium]